MGRTPGLSFDCTDRIPNSSNNSLKTHQPIHQWNTVRSVPKPNIFGTSSLYSPNRQQGDFSENGSKADPKRRSLPLNKALPEDVITFAMRGTSIPNQGSRRHTPAFRPCHSRTYRTTTHIDRLARDTDPSPIRIQVEAGPAVLTD